MLLLTNSRVDLTASDPLGILTDAAFYWLAGDRDRQHNLQPIGFYNPFAIAISLNKATAN
jgi:hypothetical protein